MSLTEIILTITGIIVYLEGKEWRVAKKNPKANQKPSFTVPCDSVTAATGTPAPWHHGSDPSKRKVTRAAQGGAELPGLVSVPGEVPTCSSQPRHHSRVGLPAVPCTTGTETAELLSQPRLICLHAHCSELATQNSCSLPHRKTGDCSTK